MKHINEYNSMMMNETDILEYFKKVLGKCNHYTYARGEYIKDEFLIMAIFDIIIKEDELNVILNLKNQFENNIKRLDFQAKSSPAKSCIAVIYCIEVDDELYDKISMLQSVDKYNI